MIEMMITYIIYFSPYPQFETATSIQYRLHCIAYTNNDSTALEGYTILLLEVKMLSS